MNIKERRHNSSKMDKLSLKSASGVDRCECMVLGKFQTRLNRYATLYKKCQYSCCSNATIRIHIPLQYDLNNLYLTSAASLGK